MFTPLEEAMARKVVIVHETNDVNEVAIENVSTTEEVFVQAGDIVKGGRQDRVLSVDLILPASRVRCRCPLFAWRTGVGRNGRGPTGLFTVSKGMVATKGLKLAASGTLRKSGCGMACYPAKTIRSVAYDARSELSGSSLQLALENLKVQESATSI